MKVIRLLFRQQQTIRERISAMHLDRAPGIEIVGEVNDVFDVLMAIKHKQADVVVASDSSADRGMVSHLLAQFPDLTVLILGSAGEVHIEQRCQQRWTTNDESGESIAKALRFAIQNPCELDDAAMG